MQHQLKIKKHPLEEKLAGNKLFEIRENDREYQKGGIVVYHEYKYPQAFSFHGKKLSEIKRTANHADTGERWWIKATGAK